MSKGRMQKTWMITEKTVPRAGMFFIAVVVKCIYVFILGERNLEFFYSLLSDQDWELETNIKCNK